MQQLDKKAVWLFFLSYFTRVFFISIVFSFWSRSWRFLDFAFQGDVENTGYGFPMFGNLVTFTIIVFIVFLIIAFLWAKLTYHFYRYELTNLGLKKESGVIYKRYVTIPYNRIQNVDIHRSLLARLLRLSDLQVQTAGASLYYAGRGFMGGGAEGRLPGLDPKVAEELRDELVKRAGEAKTLGV